MFSQHTKTLRKYVELYDTYNIAFKDFSSALDDYPMQD